MNIPVVDARGLICPLPVLKARKILLSMKAGESLCVQATDARSPQEFELFCPEAGARVTAVEERDGVFHITLQKR